ncbi:hypothetical protein [Metabacillus schmidteae]|uniref:hypothetical protein n=1 Tax=Metabacillus schmidteae TaxID=2730405 RepID=UPI00158C0C88|nr:hypothetical protein [Metabacillus schmidteae]
MFNDYELYMLSKLKQKEMNELISFSIPLTKKDKSKIIHDVETKSIEMTCCQTACC